MTIEQDVKNWLADEGVFREKAADENADFHFVIEFLFLTSFFCYSFKNCI